jgi:hypothetical protein
MNRLDHKMGLSQRAIAAMGWPQSPQPRRSRALRFYERLGFKPIGPRRFGEDECMVYRLERASWHRGT